MLVSDYDYPLPPELIAQVPLDKRENSRLLLLNKSNSKIEHRYFHELPNILTSNDVLVFNNSRVIPARLITKNKSEVFLVKRIINTKYLQYECLVRPGKKFKKGNLIIFQNNNTAEVKDILPSGLRIIQFNINNFNDFLEEYGHVPLPPYIKTRLEDPERYQTVFNQHKGSVAAPTAGLHFSKQIIKELHNKGIKTDFITLHVSLGTFQPIKTDQVEDHKIHSEFFSLSSETAKRLNQYKKEGKRIIAVGTTSVRTIEHCAQKNEQTYQLTAQNGETNIFIYPGYKFKFIDALITNFHLPKSSLLMLISALANIKQIKEAYSSAINNKYRFYSFGDSMFIY